MRMATPDRNVGGERHKEESELVLSNRLQNLLTTFLTLPLFTCLQMTEDL